MRRSACGALLAGLILVIAPAEAKPPPEKGHRVNTGEPLPKRAAPDGGCMRALGRGTVRWIGSGPSTPLAIVSRGGAVHTAGRECCAPWARMGAAYRAVDRYGQPAGEVVVAGGEGYDVTQCYELTFRATSGTLGAGLFFAGAFTSPKSAEWKPSASEIAALDAIAADIERKMVRSPSPGTDGACGPRVPLPKLSGRSLFFKTKMPFSELGVPEEVPWAAVGGPVRIFARLDHGKWTVRSAQRESSWPCRNMDYTPRAAFDINGDGRVEVVVHEDLGESFGDVIYGLGDVLSNDAWEVVARAVGGSTA